jgi:hypothetical protein
MLEGIPFHVRVRIREDQDLSPRLRHRIVQNRRLPAPHRILHQSHPRIVERLHQFSRQIFISVASDQNLISVRRIVHPQRIRHSLDDHLVFLVSRNNQRHKRPFAVIGQVVAGIVPFGGEFRRSPQNEGVQRIGVHHHSDRNPYEYLQDQCRHDVVFHSIPRNRRLTIRGHVSQ